MSLPRFLNVDVPEGLKLSLGGNINEIINYFPDMSNDQLEALLRLINDLYNQLLNYPEVPMDLIDAMIADMMQFLRDALGVSEIIEYGKAEYDPEGVTCYFENVYSNMPVLIPHIVGGEKELIGKIDYLHVDFIKSGEDYTGVIITPIGSDVPELTSAYITVCGICTGRVN